MTMDEFEYCVSRAVVVSVSLALVTLPLWQWPDWALKNKNHAVSRSISQSCCSGHVVLVGSK